MCLNIEACHRSISVKIGYGLFTITKIWFVSDKNLLAFGSGPLHMKNHRQCSQDIIVYMVLLCLN